MAEFIYGKPCTRCLLEEAGNRDMARLISERISVIPEDKKADGELYKKRLLCGASRGEERRILSRRKQALVTFSERNAVSLRFLSFGIE